MLKSIFVDKQATPRTKQVFHDNIAEAFNNAYVSYTELSQEEKNILCVELAHDMGCESDDLATCSRYIYDATYGGRPPKIH